jgi:hypothetical protein
MAPLLVSWPGGIGAPGMKSPDFFIGGGKRRKNRSSKNRTRKNRSRKNRSLKNKKSRKNYKNKSTL